MEGLGLTCMDTLNVKKLTTALSGVAAAQSRQPRTRVPNAPRPQLHLLWTFRDVCHCSQSSACGAYARLHLAWNQNQFTRLEELGLCSPSQMEGCFL